MSVHALDHLNVCTRDLEATRRFYRDVVGLVDGPRPAFSRPGAWMYAGDQAVLHISTGRSPTTHRSDPFNHMAFRASGLDALRERLRSHDIPFEEFAVPDQALHQVFFTDPDGSQVEIIFTGEEAEQALREGARVDATTSAQM